jgi:hypothetical protein
VTDGRRPAKSNEVPRLPILLSQCAYHSTCGHNRGAYDIRFRRVYNFRGQRSYQSASISVMIRICVLLVSSISWKMTHPVLGFLVNRTDVGWINKVWPSRQFPELLELWERRLPCCPGQNGKCHLPSSAPRYANIHLRDIVSLSSHLPGSFPEATRIVAYISWVVRGWKRHGIVHEKIAHEIYTTRRIFHILWKHCKL